MASPLTMQIGETFFIDVACAVDKRNVDVGLVEGSVTTSDSSKVTKEKVDDFRWKLTAVAAGTSTITATVGAVSDTMIVTVVAPTECTSVTILPAGN